MANEIIKVFNTEANAIANGSAGRIDPVAAISGHSGIIANVAAEDIPFYIYKKFYYRFEANEPVSEFHIDWDDGEDNSPEKANIEIIKLDRPRTHVITSHIYTEHKHFFPLIRVKSIDGYLSKWYTNDSSLNSYSNLENNNLVAGQNEFSNVSEEKADSDRINSFLPANLPPIGVLKSDKKRIYSGIDNTTITGHKPLLYAYSTSTASTKPDIKFTIQDSKGFIREHTMAGTYIWNANSAWVSEVINGITSDSNTYNAIPTGNTHTINNEKWRLTALDAIDSDNDAVNVAKVIWTGSNNYYIDIWYDNGSYADASQTDVDNNAGLRIYLQDAGGASESLNSSGTGKEPDGTAMVGGTTSNLSSCKIEVSNPLSADSILNDIKNFIDNNTAGVGGMQLPITCEVVTVSGNNKYIDITRVGTGATSDFSIGGISNSHMTFTKQRDGTPTVTTTEFAKKLLRVELDNATELTDTDRVYIKTFDIDTNNDGDISDDAVITNKTVAVLSNGCPIVEIEDANTVYLDGTESFTRASNLSISTYNFDEDKLNNSGAVQATDGDGVSDLMSGTFSATGTKEISYSFDNNGNSMDSDNRIYASCRLPRLQVKDNMTDATAATALDTLTYSAIEHFDDTSYTAANVEMPSDLESKGLLLFSNRTQVPLATWHDISTRNTNDSQEVFGDATGSADGTYMLQDTSNITDHPYNHLFIAKTEKFDRIFFRMDNNNDIADTMPTVAISAYYANGTTWEPLEIIDETQGLKTSGSIKFNMPHDWKKGDFEDVDSGDWVGPVEQHGNETDTAPQDLWTFNAYAILISIGVLNASSRNRLLKCMNVWPYNNSHSQLIKLEDPHHVSLNSIAIAQSISFGRSSKVISVEDKFGKADIRKIGAAGGSVSFGGIDLGNSDDDRKAIVGYQKNATPVFLDVEHKSGEKTRFFGIISQVSEDHPAGKMIPKWAVTMNISHILELSSTGAISSDRISIGGALVDDGKYLL
tara:strand:+ start:2173 stop:5133 length:2961 start_codon:yes stop_codon:yes gene_type:complete